MSALKKGKAGKAASPRSSYPRHLHHFLTTASTLLCSVPVCASGLAQSACINVSQTQPAGKAGKVLLTGHSNRDFMSRLLSCWGRDRTQLVGSCHPSSTQASFCCSPCPYLYPQSSGGSPRWLSAVPTQLSWIQHCPSAIHFNHLSVLLPRLLDCDPSFTGPPMMIAYNRWRQVKEVQRLKEKTEGKAFSFIYFSKICNCQMCLLFAEVIILSPFLRDPAVALGGGSHLFQALLF